TASMRWMTIMTVIMATRFSAPARAAPARLPPYSQSGAGADDRPEIGGDQARAADQRAVDIGHRHQFACVAGLHRSAIKDADRRGVLHLGRQGAADMAMHFA